MIFFYYLYKTLITIYYRSRFHAICVQIFAFWECSGLREAFMISSEVMTFSKSKNSCKNRAKPRSKISCVFVYFWANFLCLENVLTSKMFTEAAMMSSEVMAFSKSKNSCKNCTKPRWKIGCFFVQFEVLFWGCPDQGQYGIGMLGECQSPHLSISAECQS